MTDTNKHTDLEYRVREVLSGLRRPAPFDLVSPDEHDELIEMEERAFDTIVRQTLSLIMEEVRAAKIVTGETSDGYHTFNELYEFRLLYNAALFNEFAKAGKIEVSKSWRHSDGELCFGGGWFVVTAELPTGQITNHYKSKYWSLFNIPALEWAPEWDGHTANDVAERLRQFVGLK